MVFGSTPVGPGVSRGAQKGGGCSAGSLFPARPDCSASELPPLPPGHSSPPWLCPSPGVPKASLFAAAVPPLGPRAPSECQRGSLGRPTAEGGEGDRCVRGAARHLPAGWAAAAVPRQQRPQHRGGVHPAGHGCPDTPALTYIPRGTEQPMVKHVHQLGLNTIFKFSGTASGNGFFIIKKVKKKLNFHFYDDV